MEGACACAGNVERSDGAIRGSHEPVIYVTRVKVESLNRSCLVDSERERALERARARAWRIERRDSAVRRAQDAVIHIARVKGSCRDRPCGAKAIAGKNKSALTRTCARVRSIKRSDGAVRSAQEAVSHIATVNVASRDHLCWVDVPGESTLAGTCACTRDVEGSDDTVGSAQETVKHSARVGVVAGARACRVEAEGPGPLPTACSRARSVGRDDGAVRSTQDSVNCTARVGVASRDRPCRVDGKRDCALAGPCAAPGASNVMIVGADRSKAVLLKFRKPLLAPPDALVARVPGVGLAARVVCKSARQTKRTGARSKTCANREYLIGPLTQRIIVDPR